MVWPLKWKTVLAALGGAIAVIQLVPAGERSNPPTINGQRAENHLHYTPEVKQMVDRACMDCHSNETHWPWYSYVAPISWGIVRDVNRGRAVMNFSNWSVQAGKRPDKAATMVVAACLALKQGRMPRYPYAMFHPEAKLAPQEVDTFCKWTQAEFARLLIENRRRQRREQIDNPEAIPADYAPSKKSVASGD